MQSDWRNWCRLCATNEAIIKLESMQISHILHKYFCITLSPYNNMPEAVCEECNQFLKKLDKFSEKCLRADKMFTDIVLQNIQLLENEIPNFRYNYGIEDQVKLKPLVSIVTHNGDTTAAILRVDQSTDTADLLVLLKVEDQVEAPPRTKRKKRQPKTKKLAKSVDAVEAGDSNNAEPKIKMEPDELSINSNDNYDDNYDEEEENDQKNLSFELNLLDSESYIKNEELTDEEDDKPLKLVAMKVKRTRTRKDTKELNADEEESECEEDSGGSDKDEKECTFNLECHVCQEKFLTYGLLSKHCMDGHSTAPRIECVCGKIISSRSTMNAHQKLHNDGNKILLSCKLCNKMYNRQSAYEHHMLTKHSMSSSELVYQCTKCPKRFATEKKVKLHENVHLPDEEKMVHPCPYCDKKFTKSVNVQTHVRAIHIGDRPFICEECGKSFGTKGALKEHQITHSEDRPFQCAHCPKKFKNLPRLKTHEDTHNATIYVCPHCGLQLNTKRTLKMHMVVHSDQKKYKCQYCGNEYKRSKALKNHLILHTGLRPYLCPFCDKTFANGSNCRSHKKKAHPIELAQLEASGEQSRATNIPKLEQLQPKAMPQDEQTTLRMSDTINDSSTKWSPPPPPPSTPMSLPDTSPITAHMSHQLLLQQQLQHHSAATAAVDVVQLPILQLSHDSGLHLSANNLGLIHTNNM